MGARCLKTRLTNANVAGMNRFELIKYEKKLKRQLKNLAREITREYKDEALKGMK